MKLEDRKPVKLLYIEHTGAFDKIPFETYLTKLYGWAKDNKVMPGFYPVTIYLDDPQKTPPEKCRSEVGISVYGTAKLGEGLALKDLPKMKVAAISHKGPGSEFQNTYKALYDWIASKGYDVTGPPMEMYTRQPKTVDGQTVIYAKVMVPVKAKR